ncbi:c-type cytochrome [Stappia sp. GBMRC 2046]|uniref:C-type cytochrome n=1 Tax=Stappia sediminis TaxID=2692190 RepID=A0A7X3S995_9HYPH|nr:di-heme oxidoredictase family protein [Stappia sediminis]MXN66643.1 c-type cytochrome [Stappia sediminis]
MLKKSLPILASGLFALGLFSVPTLAGDAGPLAHRDDLIPKDRARVARVLKSDVDLEKAEPFERMSAGAATSQKHINANAFSHPSQNLSFEEQQDFAVGNGLFRKLWVSSPSSTQASDGLGPLFNARSCQGCHLKDGRGHPPREGEDAVALFLRLSVPPKTEEQRKAVESGAVLSIPEPTYGGQFQTFAVPGLKSEGRLEVDYEEFGVTLGDGTVVSLRKPTYRMTDLGFGPMADDVMTSPRVAPQMIGLGLIQAIHPGDILAMADPEDADGDGISGRISWVPDPATGERTIGRYGWKASTPSVRAQSAGAFAGDIGISTPDVPLNYGDCTKAQTECRVMPTGEQAHLGASEAPDPVMRLVDFYSRNLAVPARRDVDNVEVLAGKAVFHDLGCASCHRPKYVTSRKADIKAHRFQLIWPYTDILLHDMGEGLSDNRPVGSASGAEWRTPPLWGIGLTETVSGQESYLHDGRARTLEEAILWHGGEAEPAKNAYASLEKKDRDVLVRFLKSL